MTSFFQATREFIKNPTANYHKIKPYLGSRITQAHRSFAEMIGRDTLSKPYPGHEDLLAEIEFKNGFFVECGGNDGLMVDPTYYLEKFNGWRGIIIEPLPKMAAACKKNRPQSYVYQAALVSHEYPGNEIEIIDCNAMSVTEHSQYDIEDWVKKGEQAQKLTATRFKVPAATLDHVLESYQLRQPIDLLVIDVEGAEAEVLKGFTFQKYQPKYLLIEIHNNTLKEQVEALVAPHQYKCIKKIGFADFLFKKQG